MCTGRARSTTEPISESRRLRLKVAPPKFYAIPHNKVRDPIFMLLKSSKISTCSLI